MMINSSLSGYSSMFRNVESTVIVVAAGTLWLTYQLSLKTRTKALATTNKQGAYGKIKTHKESKLSMLTSPSEVWAMIQVKLLKKSTGKGLVDESRYNLSQQESLSFCAEKLEQVSRSFALVIKFLPNDAQSPLRVSVAVFYLVLRALDTVEDEMDLKKFEPFITAEDRANKNKLPGLAAKERLLREFSERLQEDFSKKELFGLGEAHELELLNEFHHVKKMFETLPLPMQNVITQITDEMGKGMSEYVSRDLRNGTIDDKDFSDYCYIVAGTVGKGLTELFAVYDDRLEGLAQQPERYKSMGEFLQRTNIIRDYLEDFVDGRAFWPQTVWHMYLSKEQQLAFGIGAFARPEVIRRGASVACLNHMIKNALQLLPDVFNYLSSIDDQAVYSFCALPQIMALATLTECFDNPKVFTGVVKLRKGMSAKIVCDFAPKANAADAGMLKEAWIRWVKLCLHKLETVAKKSPTAQILQPTVAELKQLVE